MKNLMALLGALLVTLALGAPALALDGPPAGEGRVLISIDGDLTVPSGESADAVIVIQGDALIEGTVASVTVVGGTATLRGAEVDTLAIIDGRAVLESGTIVSGDVLELNATVEQADGVIVEGAIRALAQDLAGLALFLGMAAIALWVGAVLAMIVAGLALAGLAARQVRATEAIISGQPLKAFLVGLAMVVLPPIVMVLLAVTIVGLPLALSILFMVWPALAFVGYLIGAIWLGDWVLKASGRRRADRPYLAAFVGVLLAGALSFVPLVGAVISVFGLGAVTVAGWRTLAGTPPSAPVLHGQAAPVPG